MKKSPKKKGNNFEKKTLRSIGSGKLWFSPLDIRSNNFVIECKDTDKKSFRITLKLLEKIWEEALSMEKEPFLRIGIKRNEDERFVIDCRINVERR